jgi:hypothetical protein
MLLAKAETALVRLLRNAFGELGDAYTLDLVMAVIAHPERPGAMDCLRQALPLERAELWDGLPEARRFAETLYKVIEGFCEVKVALRQISNRTVEGICHGAD